MKWTARGILAATVFLALLPGLRALADDGASPGEDPAKRDAFSRHTYLGNGLWRAEIHGQPIHYLDDRGQWTPIETAVREEGGGLTNRSNSLESRFDENGVSYAVRGEACLCFTPGEIRVAGRDGSLRAFRRAQPVPPVREGPNRVRYVDVFPDVDYVYEVRPGTVKCYILVHTAAALAGCSETGIQRVEFAGMLAVSRPLGTWLEDGSPTGDAFDTAGSVAFREGPAGPPILTIPAPLAWDGGLQALPVDAPCLTPRYRFAKTTGGWDFSVSVPASWIFDPERSYPLVIDPTFTVNSAKYQGWMDAAGSTVNGIAHCGPTASGANLHTWFNWDITSIPDSSTVTKVEHRTYLDACTHNTGTGTVTIYDFSAANGYAPYTAHSSAVYNDLGGGNSYTTFTAGAVGAYPSSTTYYTLSAQAVTDVQNSLQGNTFQVGYTLTPSAGGALVKRFGSTLHAGAVNRQEIRITYTASGVTHTLTVASAHGTPAPAVGTHTCASGASVTCSVSSPAAGPTGTRYVCTGYTGTGDLASGGTGTSVTFTITQNSSITWTWQTEYQLTTAVNPAGSGMVTATPAGTWFAAGTSVSLGAAGNTGYSFSSWSGSVTGTANPATLVMNAPASVTAHFQAVSGPVLTVASAQGSPSPAVGVHAYTAGASVTCTVSSPVPGTAGIRYVCTGWTGTGDVPASGTATSTTFNITQASSITWTWRTEYSLVLQANPPGSGSVVATPSQAWYDAGTSVSLLATPNTGYTFVSWSGSVTGILNPATLVMNGPETVTANFLDPSAPGLVLAPGPANPLASDVPAAASGVPLLQLRLTAGAAEDIDVSALGISVMGGSDETVTVSGAHCYLDADSDGAYTPGTDTAVHTGATFALDDGSVFFTPVTPVRVPAGGSVDLLVTFDLDAATGDDFTASVIAGSDVTAQGVTSLVTVFPLGAPVSGGTKTVSGPASAEGQGPPGRPVYFVGGCQGPCGDGGGGGPVLPLLILAVTILLARRGCRASTGPSLPATLRRTKP
jgi:hypothetical protein